jgi:cell division protein ZapB
VEQLTLCIRLFIVFLFFMPDPSMTDHYFIALEQKIDQLLARCEQLERENQQLRSLELQARQEKSRLLQVNDQTRSQVEKMIQRLKTLEQNI